MLSCALFYDTLIQSGINFFTGVPDSLLKHFCGYLVTTSGNSQKHVIAANEGGAIALACGHYLATEQPALVYMQNSGLGNAANPLISLADKRVYSIPMLMLIGWRGEPGCHDEPQHIQQGQLTLPFLDLLEIPYGILPDTNVLAQKYIEKTTKMIQELNCPAALVVRKGTFEPCQSGKDKKINFHDTNISREEAIRVIAENLTDSDIIVSTTGKISRELYEYRDTIDGNHSRDFLTVGSMGHASQIAMGIALSTPQRQVFLLDGDGAAIMHLGAMAIIGSEKITNLKHLILNNGAHESVGGQPTAGSSIRFRDIAKGCGYAVANETSSSNQIKEHIALLKHSPGPGLLEIKVRNGSREDLGRPKKSPQGNKLDFMRFLSK